MPSLGEDMGLLDAPMGCACHVLCLPPPGANLGDISETVLKMVCPAEPLPDGLRGISVRELKRRLLVLGLREEDLGLPLDALQPLYHGQALLPAPPPPCTVHPQRMGGTWTECQQGGTTT